MTLDNHLSKASATFLLRLPDQLINTSMVQKIVWWLTLPLPLPLDAQNRCNEREEMPTISQRLRDLIKLTPFPYQRQSDRA